MIKSIDELQIYSPYVFISSYQEAINRATALILACAKRCRESQGSFTLGTATGDSWWPCYQELAKRGFTLHSDENSHQLDNFIGTSAEDPGDFRYQLHENFWKLVNVSQTQWHVPPNILSETLQQELESFDQMLLKQGIDLQLFGMGIHGHVAFWERFVNQEQRVLQFLNSGTSVQQLEDSTRIHNIDKFSGLLRNVPKEASTQGPKTFFTPRLKIILINDNPAKATPLGKALLAEPSGECPIGFLNYSPNVIWLVSESAAGDLIGNDLVKTPWPGPEAFLNQIGY